MDENRWRRPGPFVLWVLVGSFGGGGLVAGVVLAIGSAVFATKSLVSPLVIGMTSGLILGAFALASSGVGLVVFAVVRKIVRRFWPSVLALIVGAGLVGFGLNAVSGEPFTSPYVEIAVALPAVSCLIVALVYFRVGRRVPASASMPSSDV